MKQQIHQSKQKFDDLKKQSAIYFLLYFLLTPIFYYTSSHFGHFHYSFETGWDRLIPFVPSWVFIYHLYYPLALITAWLLMRREPNALNELTASLIAGNWLGILSFLVIQSEVPRPVVTVTDIPTWVVHMTYRFDRPYNGFPSLHVITMTCVLVALARSSLPRWIKATGIAVAILIIISTVMVKQHVLLDIPGGILYASVGVAISRSYFNTRKKLIRNRA